MKYEKKTKSYCMYSVKEFQVYFPNVNTKQEMKEYDLSKYKFE